MSSLASGIVGAIISDYALPKPDAIFCDIGGSKGSVIANFLKHYPKAQGFLFDQASVVKAAQTDIASAGMSERIKTVGGSFFEPLPTVLEQCDVFFMKFILHDWDDQSCIKILKNIKNAAKPGAVLVNADFIIGAHPAASGLERFEIYLLTSLFVPSHFSSCLPGTPISFFIFCTFS